MTTTQWILKWLLVVSGLFLILALLAVLLPATWMDSAHRWLGLGDFPMFPITLYLARSTSLLYGVHGVMMTYTGLTIEHHWRMVPVFGWLHLLLGATMLCIDISAGMPNYWTFFEGPPVAGLGIAIIWLARQAGDFSAAGTDEKL